MLFYVNNIQVNGYDNSRVVHSFYRSKYFLTFEEGKTSDNNLQRPLPVNYLEKVVGEHRSNDVSRISISSQDEREHVAGNRVHKVTILNLPETAQASGLHEASMKSPSSVTFGKSFGGETKESTCEKSPPAPIYPWVNADGSINKVVFDGLVRRVLGTVMQNPGIPEVKKKKTSPFSSQL